MVVTGFFHVLFLRSFTVCQHFGQLDFFVYETYKRGANVMMSPFDQYN